MQFATMLNPITDDNCRRQKFLSATCQSKHEERAQQGLHQPSFLGSGTLSSSLSSTWLLDKTTS